MASLTNDAEDIAELVAPTGRVRALPVGDGFGGRVDGRSGGDGGGDGGEDGNGGGVGGPVPVLLLGHSTGCLLAVVYARGGQTPPPAGFILHAPV